MKPDYYESLGVSRNATEAEIKRNYRSRAKQYHPDLNPDNPEAEIKFKEISEAYEVLMNPDKRAAYDRYGHNAFSGGQGGFGGFGQGGFGGFAGADFSDIFEDVFSSFMGGSPRNRNPNAKRRGDDLRYDIQISLEEAFTGVTKTITIPLHEHCHDCDGTGSKDKSKPSVCPVCGGRGKVRRQQGFFIVEAPCSNCNGTGKVVSNPCPNCNGTGLSESEKTFDIKIPAGVEDGTRMRLAGEGDAGLNGGEKGDLYIFISIKSSKIFSRNGADLYCTLPISIVTAILGTDIKVPSPHKEDLSLFVPKGTQNDARLKLKGKGMPMLNAGGKRGDLYVDVKIQMPTSLTARQEDLLRQFEEEGNNHTPIISDFINKFKDFFVG